MICFWVRPRAVLVVAMALMPLLKTYDWDATYKKQEIMMC